MAISKQRDEQLKRRMHKLGIHEHEIEESFIRSSGPGGQNVNKVATCVVLVHQPTGIQVKCQHARTQKVNRFKARELLLDKIEEKREKAALEKSMEKAKKYRQRRKRPKPLKEEILQKKKYQSEKKQSRQKIRSHNIDKFI